MSDIDLVVRGGMVADGTGGPLREADIAVRGGKILAVGEVAGKGREEIDAKGLLVTPGFIDLHTHFDGQLTWSDRLDPSSSHGVTTVVTGNCGVGFAPCREEDREQLVRLMEGVEDIPEIVMAEGLPWDWESFGDYMDSVERRPHDIDYSVLLPHAPLRVFVMGQRAVDLEPSTEADRARMRQLAGEAVAAGASGFSTSRSMFHRASDGSHIPTMRAEDEELRQIALGLAEAGRGVIQAITMKGEWKLDEYEALHRIAAETGRPLSYTTTEIPWAKELLQETMMLVERDAKAGADVRMQIFNRPVGVVLGLEASFNPFVAHPFYMQHLAHLDLAERVRRMRDPLVRASLLEPAGQLNHPLAHNLTAFDQMYIWDETPDYEPDPSSSVAALAQARGVSPYEIIYDALIRGDGRSMMYVASTNYSNGHLDSVLQLMRHDRAVVALGDGGAHYGLICDSSYTTFMLTHWTRDRSRGERLELTEAVRMLTDAPARLQRFRDRGRIAPGLKADLNVIDMDRLKLFSPTVIRDLPAGGKRLIQRADGYVATIVSGTPIRREGQDTGARPGRLVRDAGF